ncbi:hypothetical protein [Thiolinea disciformis]|uniref:hypothetical protein n=1 Tax=Thiolinea disciformis TaxID=125614 RepID=UPI000374B719|nr:hypothetical protein [Thiolinea disciformis]
MKSSLILSAFMILVSHTSAFALDSACEPLLSSSAAKIAQPAWHAIHSEGEAIRIADQSFMKMEGQWMKSPIDLNQVEQQVIDQVKSGAIKVTDCKEAGTETLDGKAMRIFTYTTEVLNSGIPAAKAKLYIGKEDGLPYLQTDVDDKEANQVTYRYTGVKAPSL